MPIHAIDHSTCFILPITNASVVPVEFSTGGFGMSLTIRITLHFHVYIYIKSIPTSLPSHPHTNELVYVSVVVTRCPTIL